MQLSNEIVSCDSPVARLYERSAPALFAFLRRKVPAREDAEDILAQTFIAAIEYDGFSQLSEKEQNAWIWRVAHNKTVDAYRRARLRQGMDLELFTDVIYDEEERAPEQISLKREEYAQLCTHLEQLPFMQREAVRLRFANDLRCAEIAKILGKSEGAIRVLLSRALNLLRRVYAQDQGGTHL
jgi:RNA polymerase sigma-70 factor (ECF subfamily)